MRKAVGVLLAAAMVLPVGLVAAPASADALPFCASSDGTMTFSVPLPIFGDPTTVTPTITGSITLAGCEGLGVTSATATYTAKSAIPLNCKNVQGQVLSNSFYALHLVWNTGQTSTIAKGDFGDNGTITAGLFKGTVISPPDPSFAYSVFFSGDCITSPATTLTTVSNSPSLFSFPFAAAASCTAGIACSPTVGTSATATAPGLTATATGTPAAGKGTVHLAISAGTLPCPSVPVKNGPVADLTDTGFKPKDLLTVTATLPLTASTSAEQVCFNSSVPFKSQSSPKVAKAGSAYLLACAAVAIVAPCVLSSTPVGTDIVVKFVVRGGDPRFSIVVPKGKGTQVWPSHFPGANQGQRYKAQMQSLGGIGAVHWTVASGALPTGCTLNAKTGAITGTPQASGQYSALIEASDSETPPKTAEIRLPFTVS